jgi:hypothetical protein
MDRRVSVEKGGEDGGTVDSVATTRRLFVNTLGRLFARLRVLAFVTHVPAHAKGSFRIKGDWASIVDDPLAVS